MIFLNEILQQSPDIKELMQHKLYYQTLRQRSDIGKR